MKYVIVVELRLNGQHTTYYNPLIRHAIKNKKWATKFNESEKSEAEQIAKELTNGFQEAFVIQYKETA